MARPEGFEPPTLGLEGFGIARHATTPPNNSAPPLTWQSPCSWPIFRASVVGYPHIFRTVGGLALRAGDSSNAHGTDGAVGRCPKPERSRAVPLSSLGIVGAETSTRESASALGAVLVGIAQARARAFRPEPTPRPRPGAQPSRTSAPWQRLDTSGRRGRAPRLSGQCSPIRSDSGGLGSGALGFDSRSQLASPRHRGINLGPVRELCESPAPQVRSA